MSTVTKQPSLKQKIVKTAQVVALTGAVGGFVALSGCAMTGKGGITCKGMSSCKSMNGCTGHNGCKGK